MRPSVARWGEWECPASQGACPYGNHANHICALGNAPLSLEGDFRNLDFCEKCVDFKTSAWSKTTYLGDPISRFGLNP